MHGFAGVIFLLGVLMPTDVRGSGCGGNLVATTTRKRLESPGYPSYSNGLQCRWTIRSDAGTTVHLSFITIDMEDHSRCSYDYVAVYDGSSTYATRLGKYCGHYSSAFYLQSTSNILVVTFSTDSTVTRRGFQADYKSVCGGLLQGTRGIIHSPLYPSAYDNNVSCVWTVQVTSGHSIQLTFEAFDIQGTQGSCSGDYLEIRNGGYASSPPIGCSGQLTCKLCGDAAPTLSASSSNKVSIKFVSDHSGQSTGFKIVYRQVAFSCTDRLTLTDEVPSGNLMSPNYPDAYPHNIDCTWIIEAPNSELVQVDFQDFDIESSNFFRCRYDFLELRDGGTESSPLIRQFCGKDKPDSVRSTTSKLYMRFRTDGSFAGRGFKARYAIATCGGTFNSRSGVLQSPNYPSNYDTNANCTWYIHGPFGHYINITFDYFELQTSDGCSKDFIELRHKNESGYLLGRFCGSSTPDTIRFPDGDAFVRFVSDSSVTAKGFRMRYVASHTECGGSFTAPSGHFTSPGYPVAYPHSRECVFRIRLQLGRRIKLVIDNINIGVLNYYCDTRNVLTVYDGSEDDSRIARICGRNRVIAPKYSSSNTMTVVFVTDGSSSNRGFSASYSSQEPSGCGGLITGPQSGVITSPGYVEGRYDNSAQCTWFFVNPNGTDRSTILQFTSFSLESSSTCTYDYVEIGEGSNENRGLIGRYCGNNRSSTAPPPFIISPRTLRVKFRTDSSLTYRGFQLSYNFSQCGGVLSDESGIITSPNYPSAYPPNLACVWLIQAPEGHKIQVHTEDFNVQPSKDCQLDYLIVLNGDYASSPSIGRFCSNGTNALNFRSMTNHIRIEFRTDAVISAKGFKLRYMADNTGCGGFWHSSAGQLTSPNFPNHYPHNIECIWDIMVAPGSHVDFTFNTPFAVDGEPGKCTYDYVEVSDYIYKTGKYTPILHACGNRLPPSQRSSNNRLRVKFRSDPWTNATGFSANWTTGCGFISTAQSGIFSSPGYPRAYDHNVRCEYLITGDPMELIIVEFKAFRLEGYTNCLLGDSLTIYEGSSTSQPPIRRLCGSKSRFSASAKGNMLLVFSTDSSLSYSGFNATFRRTSCGGELTTPTGTLASSSHLPTYHRNFACRWTITVKQNRVVEIILSVSTSFRNPCRDDYIEVRDGVGSNATSLGRFCGYTSTKSIQSTGNKMEVTVVSDGLSSSLYFSLSYRTTIGVNQGCGGVLTSPSGTFGFPPSTGEEYGAGLTCTWFISLLGPVVPFLTFNSLDIEYHSRCIHGYVQVRNGNTSTAPLFDRYCGTTTPAPIIASSKLITVTLVSNAMVSRNLFNISYRSVDECNWSTWSMCSSSCSHGYQRQTRKCAGHSVSRSRSCYGSTCWDSEQWSEWGDWRNCTRSCKGGVSSRSRTCVTPRYGNPRCVAASMETKSCNTHPCPVDGKWSTWNTWSKCSVSCGTGQAFRTRSCTPPQHGGKLCEGDERKHEPCLVKECPVHGNWSEWAPWSSCSKTCDYGQMSRIRLCSQPLHGGRPCKGDSTEWKKCQIVSCQLDGMWSGWDEWTLCNEKCGGYRTRQRKCNNPSPANDGKPCDGAQRERGECRKCADPNALGTGEANTGVATIVGITVGGIIVIVVIVGAAIIIYKRMSLKGRERSSGNQPEFSNEFGNVPPPAYADGPYSERNVCTYSQAGARIVCYDNKAFSGKLNDYPKGAYVGSAPVYERTDLTEQNSERGGAVYETLSRYQASVTPRPHTGNEWYISPN